MDGGVCEEMRSQHRCAIENAHAHIGSGNGRAAAHGLGVLDYFSIALRSHPTLKEFFVQLVGALPSLRNKFAVTGVIVAVAGYVATRAVDASAVQAQICVASLGITFLVFGQVFHAIEFFPPKQRSSLVLSLFIIFALLVLGLIGATGYFLLEGKRIPPTQTAFDARSDRTPIPPNRVQHDSLPGNLIDAKTLQANEGRMLLEFGGFHRVGYPIPEPNHRSFVSHPEGKKGIEFQTGGFVWSTKDALGRFALVSHTGGPYVIEALYLKVHRFAECALRDEHFEHQAPDTLPGYAFYVSNKHNVYDLVPRVDLGGVGVWRLKGQDQDEFSLSIQYPPYTLFVFSLMAEIRDESTGESFRLRSAFYPLLRVANGNTGGCLDLASWYDASLLRKPEASSYQSLADNLLSYQLLTVDSKRDRTFLLKTVQTLPLEALAKVSEDIANALRREPENTVFRENQQWFNNLREWRGNGAHGDPP